jgi:phage terminase small subunit
MRTFEDVPILKNERHEIFAQKLAAGKTATEAYELAGFKPSRKNASRLRAKEDIAARVLEIQQAAADGCKISIQSVCKELDEAITLAKAKGQPNALVSAAGLRAKLGGLLIEKQEVAITRDDPYEDMSTAAEVLAKVVDDLGLTAAVALAAAFELPYDEAAIRVMCEADNAGNAGNGQQAIERRPPRGKRKRGF